MSLTEKIRELCNGKNTNFAAVERELGFGQGTIRKWDKVSPGIDKLQKLADYFRVSLDSLMEREGYDQLGNIYFNFAKDAEKNAIDPRDIELAIEMIKKFKDK